MTGTTLRRKNIDLPVDTLQKLSLMAVAQGKSLKKYIESLLISKANSITIEVKESLTPSEDEWFLDPENIKEVKEGIRQMNNKETKSYSLTEIKSMLGL